MAAYCCLADMISMTSACTQAPAPAAYNFAQLLHVWRAAAPASNQQQLPCAYPQQQICASGQASISSMRWSNLITCRTFSACFSPSAWAAQTPAYRLLRAQSRRRAMPCCKSVRGLAVTPPLTNSMLPAILPIINTAPLHRSMRAQDHFDCGPITSRLSKCGSVIGDADLHLRVCHSGAQSQHFAATCQP